MLVVVAIRTVSWVVAIVPTHVRITKFCNSTNAMFTLSSLGTCIWFVNGSQNHIKMTVHTDSAAYSQYVGFNVGPTNLSKAPFTVRSYFG